MLTVDHINRRLDALFALDVNSLSRSELINEINKISNIEYAMSNSRLSFLDRNLTLWIFIAMALGVGIGVFFPQASVALDRLSVDSVNIPIVSGSVKMTP